MHGFLAAARRQWRWGLVGVGVLALVSLPAIVDALPVERSDVSLDDLVQRIAVDLTSTSSRSIAVGDGPAAVAFGDGAVWVANSGDGTVSRIDPETYEVVKTIEVGGAPAGIALSDGRVWVSVQAPFTP